MKPKFVWLVWRCSSLESDHHHLLHFFPLISFFYNQVYTINQESKYLMVTGVPTVGATQELLQQFALYGDIEE